MFCQVRFNLIEHTTMNENISLSFDSSMSDLNRRLTEATGVDFHRELLLIKTETCNKN